VAANKADKVDKFDEHNEADDAVKVVEAKVDKIDAANEVNVAEEANVIGKIVVANEANKASLAKANESLANGDIAVIIKYPSKLLRHDTIVICVDVLSQFSLTKYSVFVAEVKGYFGMNNNQLGGPFDGNEINNQLGTV
jgi:hypothetical protein